MSPRGGGRLADGSMSEAAFQGAVIGLARFYDWRIYHPPDNKPSLDRRGRAGRQHVEPGFPDLTLIRDDVATVELLVAELKAERGRMGPGQAAWLDAWGNLSLAVREAVARAQAYEAEHTIDGGRSLRVPTVDVYLWRPSDWPAIEARLARGRVLQPWPLGA